MRLKITAYDSPVRCEKCKHFHQHFVAWESDERGFKECGCGHCTRERPRTARAFCTCPYFEAKEPM